MLEKAFPYRAAFTSIRWMERSTSSFPNLPIDEECSRVEKICDLVQRFDEKTTIIFSTRYPIADLYLKNVWKITVYHLGLLVRMLFLRVCNKNEERI